MKAILARFLKIFSNIMQKLISMTDRATKGKHAELFGGAKNTRRIVSIFLALLLIALVGSLFLKNQILLTPSMIVDKETAAGIARDTFISDTPVVEKGDLVSSNLEDKVDCKAIINSLRGRGTLTQKETILYNDHCKEALTEAEQIIMDKLLKKEISNEVASKLLDMAKDPEKAKSVEALVKNVDVMNALSGKYGEGLSDSMLENIDQLASLNEEEMTQAMDILKKTPPSSRQDAIKAIANISNLKSPEARKAMLTSLEKAKSPEEIKDVASFANTIAKGSEEEQAKLSEAFERTAPEARKELIRATEAIMEMDANDPVRKKMVDFVEEASKLSPEEQAKAYGNIADVAEYYNSITDPALKKAFGDKIMDMESLDEMAALAEKVNTVNALEDEFGKLPTDDAIAYFEGKDPDLDKKIENAKDLLDAGAKDIAKQVYAGKPVAEGDVKKILAAKETIRNSSDNKKEELNKVSPAEIKEKQKEITAQKIELSALDHNIKELVSSGISPTDPKILSLYKRYAEVETNVKSLDEELIKMRSSLNDKVKKLSEDYQQTLTSMGYKVPKELLEISNEDALAEAPVRLGDIKDHPAFWVGMDRKTQAEKKYSPFEKQKGSLLDEVSAGYKDGWELKNVSSTAGGMRGDDGSKTIKLPRDLVVIGTIVRLPELGMGKVGKGYFSEDLTSSKVFFKFKVPVVDRRSGRVIIPSESVAICKPKDFSRDSGRLFADCDAVDTGDERELKVSITLGDASGAVGLLGKVIDERGWELAGIFMTAFTASVLDGLTSSYVTPLQEKAAAGAGAAASYGMASGSAQVLSSLGEQLVSDLAKNRAWWIGYDEMLATIQQK